MNKVFLVIQREYLARVKKKSFLIATLLTPLIFPAIMGVFKDPKGIQFYGLENPSLSLIGYLESALKRKIENQRLFNEGIDPEILQEIKTEVSIQSLTLQDSGEEVLTDAGVNYELGFLSGILIYLFIFLYGNQIMQGVIEEKSSRIVEILVSSLKPFQLMMGKIVGIGAVGLTQFLIWVILISVLSSLVLGVLGIQMPQQQALEMTSPEAMAMAQNQGDLGAMLQVIHGIDFVSLLVSFILYFLGGYLLYGALFAAVGAAVDSPSYAQQFMFPITIPLIVAYLGLFVFVLQDPNSTTSFWLSIFPFTSPIAMMGRISYGVPFWELALSLGLLVAGFLLTTQLAAKIYRIGILSHGTKPSYKLLWKWIRSK